MTEDTYTKLSFLDGGGEMGELIRTMDWSSTALDKPENWPPALKQTVSMLLTTTFPVLICWGDDYIQLYNDAFRPINGTAKHPQALGGSAKDTYAEIWDTIGPMFAGVMKGKAVGFPNFLVRLERNGYPEDCYFDFSYSPIRDEQGSVGGILVICVETTQNVRNAAQLLETNEELAAANEELTAINEEMVAINEELAETQVSLQNALTTTVRNEKLFRSIVLSIPRSLIIVIDREHRYVTIDGDIMERMGYDRRDYEGKHPTEVGTAERYEASRPLYDRVLAGEQFSVERKAETGEDYMVHFVPLRNEQGEVERGLIIALDITEVKKAEEKSAKLAAIIDSSDDAIISKTLESVITSWNDSAERLFGYTADEIIGETIYKLIPPDRQQEEPMILSRLKNGERVEHFETKRLRKDGRLIDISVTVSPVRDPRGNIIGLSKIARDITEKKQEEQRKNDFVAMVSHELKTPLTTILSYVQLLLSQAKKEGDNFRINALTRTEVQAKKMVTMIHDFLTMARLEEGKVPLNKVVFDVHELAAEVTDDAQILTTKHHVKLVDCEGLNVNADRDKIGQVLTNLLSNAIKYSPGGGEISIGCERQGDKVKIFVADKGVGISANDQKRLFERFYRSNNEKLKTVSGFGVGLYLVSEILRFHDSGIEVDSTEGVGSTFYFMLPLV